MLGEIRQRQHSHMGKLKKAKCIENPQKLLAEVREGLVKGYKSYLLFFLAVSSWSISP